MNNVKFGILCYDTINIGDEIQSIAMKRLLPKVDYYVLRDNMSIVYDNEYKLVDIEKLENLKIHLFINGWFAENNKTKYTFFHFPIPDFIHPIFISIYMNDWFVSNILDKNLDYFKKYEPIGCRDKSTLRKLISRGIKAEFVGCPTLTIDNFDFEEKNDIVYYVDSDKFSKIEDGVIITHININKRTMEQRFNIAEEILEKYRKCKKIYTSRLHCYLPCKAMKKDVQYVGKTDERFEGLINLSDKEYENIKNNIKTRVNEIVLNLQNLQKEAIFVTGGLGFIGSNTVYEIVLNFPNHQIVIIDDLSNSFQKVFKDLCSYSNNLFFYEGDINDKLLLNKIFNSHKIVSVVHFAAHKIIGESINYPLKYYENNIGGLISLLKVMEKFSVKKMIFSSSAAVYGIPEKLPLEEENRTIALNPYAKTKLFCEEILRDMKDMKIVCLRYFNPVGLGIFGESKKEATNLFPYIISVIKGEKEKLKIYGGDYETKDGTAIRDYLHIKDLCLGHISALKYLETMNENFEIFNLGTGNGFSVLEVVNSFQNILGKKIPYEIVDKREGDLPIVFANCSKARKKLGWGTKLNLEDMISDCLKNIR